MKPIHIRLALVALTLVLVSPVIPVVAGQARAGSSSASDLPAGKGKDALLRNCVGCHQLNVITSQHKAESGWTDTVVEMRSRGANGSDEEMEQIVRYLTTNFGLKPAQASSAASSSDVSSTAGLPPKNPQATPQKVIDEHIAALNSCDWNRVMAQYDDNIEILSKDGGVLKGREAVGAMFRAALQPPSVGGMCGMKLTPEHTVVVGDTVNVVWRAEAPFLAEPYRASEAFETRNGLLALEVTTSDPAAIKLKR